MTWNHDIRVVDRKGVWIKKVKVDLSEVEIGDLYGMQDTEMDVFQIQQVVAINCDNTLMMQDNWSRQVRNVKVDVLLKPDYLSVSSNLTPIFWGRALPLCKEEFNHHFG